MQGFYSSLFGDPMFYVGLAFAFLAALAFLVFLRGFLSGIPGLFTLSAHEEHQEHHVVRATWGVMLLIYLFIWWELLRFTVGLFTGATAPTPLNAFWALILWLLLAVLPFVF